MKILVLTSLVVALSAAASSQTINTTCSLYPSAAYCTSTVNNNAARIAEQQRENYQTGYAAGSAVGSAIFRSHFPGWRHKYCAQHPGQPFYYGNARGDSIAGTCPNLQQLSDEAAQQYIAKHPNSIRSEQQAAAMQKYIADNGLPPWEEKSYEKAQNAVTP